MTQSVQIQRAVAKLKRDPSLGTRNKWIPVAGEQEKAQILWKVPRVPVLAQGCGSSRFLSKNLPLFFILFFHNQNFLFPALGRREQEPQTTHLFHDPMENAVLVSTPREDHTGRVRIAKKGSVGSSGCPETSPCSRFELGAEGIPQGRAGHCQGWSRGSHNLPVASGQIVREGFLVSFH